jgi:acetyl esterase/lipase
MALAIRFGAVYERLFPTKDPIDKKLTLKARAFKSLLKKSTINTTPPLYIFRERMASYADMMLLPLPNKRYYRLVLEKMNNSSYVLDRGVKSNSQKTLLMYIHGGGLIAGSPDGAMGIYKIIGSMKKTGVDYLGVNYSLLPENTVERAIKDVVEAYKFAFEQGYHSISMLGDSAGANLTLLSLVEILKEKEWKKKLFGVIFFSPFIDLTMSTESFKSLAKVDLIFSSHVSSAIAQNLNLSEEDLKKYSFYHQMKRVKLDIPRVFISYSTTERCADEAEQLWEVLKNERSAVQKVPGMVHNFQLFAPLFSEATVAVKLAAAFVE